MLRKLSWSLAGTILGSLVFMACGSAGSPSSSTDAKAPPSQTVAPSGKAAWEQKWDTLLAEAKKEGELLVYTNANAEAKKYVAEGFTAKYGISLDYLSLSSGSELYARASNERKAGINLADVYIAGSSSLVGGLKSEGLITSLDPLLVLPEVLDPAAWIGKGLPFSDKEKMAFALINSPWGPYVYNTDQIKKGEITSYLDALKPQYKGKIVMYDPSISGAGNSLITHLSRYVLDKEKALDFLRRLIREQDVVMTRDARLQIEWVAFGKYALGLGPGTRDTSRIMGLGAPLGVAWPKEGVYTTSGGGTLGVSKYAPHPKAAAVFVNYLLTKDGLTRFSKGFGQNGTRVDIPGVTDPDSLPGPDIKLFGETDDDLAAQQAMLEPAKQVMAAASK